MKVRSRSLKAMILAAGTLFTKLAGILSAVILARSRLASPRLSSVRPVARKSSPQTAEPSASRPLATGQGTPAQSATDVRNESPIATSSVM